MLTVPYTRAKNFCHRVVNKMTLISNFNYKNNNRKIKINAIIYSTTDSILFSSSV